MKNNDDQVSLSLLRDVISRREFDRAHLTVSADFNCPPDFPAFDGHFPGQPVLPAVIQLAVVRTLSMEMLNRPLLLDKTAKLKFKNMVRPDEKVSVEVELKEIEKKWHAKFSLKTGHGIVATGGLIFKEIQD